MSDASPGGPDLMILVGSSSLRERLHDLLTSAGLTIESAEPGQEGLDEVARRMPLSLVLDSVASRPTGLDACRHLKTRDATRTIPVTVIVPDGDDVAVSDALDAGADEVLTEDAADALIVLRIRAALRSHVLTLGMLQAEREAAIGRLLGGIMHEARNPLHGVSLVTYLLSKKIAADGEARELLDDLTQGVTRLKDVIETVMSALRSNPEDIPVDIGGLVRAAVKFSVDSRTRDRLKIDNRCPGDLPMIQGIPGRLLQVFLSLIAYATRLILDGPGRGVLVIDGRGTAEAEGGQSVQIDLHAADVVVDPQDFARIFDPFSVPIPPPHSFGLCLARETVRHYGGRIQLESNPARGSIFRVSLPCERPRTAVEAPSGSVAAQG